MTASCGLTPRNSPIAPHIRVPLIQECMGLKYRLEALGSLSGGRRAGEDRRNVQWFRGGLLFEALDYCITQLEAGGPSWNCNESREEEKEEFQNATVRFVVLNESSLLLYYSPA